MGNRAVITTKENFKNNGVGIYLHWNGGRDSVEAFLTYCKLMQFREPELDNYGWAYLTTIIGNYFGTGRSIGIDQVENLDCDNYDNGTYLIENWEIVGRKFFQGIEQRDYPLKDMLLDISEHQPKHFQLSLEEIEEYCNNIGE